MKEVISRFAPAIIIFAAGLVLLIFGLSSGQSNYFHIASASVLLIALIALLNAAGMINAKISTAISAVLAVLSGVLLYLNVNSIQEPIEFQQEKKKRYSAVIQRLKDIREAQLAYHRKYQKYTSSFDTLSKFIKEEKMEMIRMEGTAPDTLTEEEALERGLIKRDTTMIPVKDYVFGEEYMKSRNKQPIFHPDSLRYIPYTKRSEFDMFTNIVVRSSGMEVSVFEVVDTDPFDPEDVLKVGSLEEPTTSGNWSSEK